ncbi:hypothetical protein L1987_55158 [Smallanthus sonchifolius]|uniref:Uncharacterized protein n=1 Tax=Smallanthus sonchifolius TaxID=185202 RepID=A0ACB9E9H9_9ASTR|nr:hypothetical protein L1987_55158 [Smallanthus sonchifolius]
MNTVHSGGPMGLPIDPATQTSKHRYVAVEFDTYSGNDWDPIDPDINSSIGDHVGININSITSIAYKKWYSNITYGKECRALISYYSDSKNLSVSFTGFINNSLVWETGLHYTIDLKLVLPEWVIFGFSASTGNRSTKESDVFSFGVVALEIACGRNAIDYKAQEKQVRLLEWVWELYGNGALFEAIDPNLGSEFEEREIRRLMIVGLSCAHPDSEHCPSMREAIKVLNSKASMPLLPSKMPVASYFTPLVSSLSDFSSNVRSDFVEEEVKYINNRAIISSGRQGKIDVDGNNLDGLNGSTKLCG